MPIHKHFVTTYRTFDIYRIADTKGEQLYIAEKMNPQNGVTRVAETFDAVRNRIDEMFVIAAKMREVHII
ncbi:MAG: hypothetical protein IJ560_01115 [Alphaproteobacteria bacterium]|nr:hypothetical protein [Alphaproteobacteria bacterium]